MTLIELLFFLLILVLTIFAGHWLSHWLGLRAFVPAAALGALFVFVMAIFIFASFKELWRTTRDQLARKNSASQK